MKIYTRQGDDGTTSLTGVERVTKDHLRVEAYGTLDELNCHIGHAAEGCPRDDLLKLLGSVQDHLFVLGAELATPSGKHALRRVILDDDVKCLETHIDRLTDQLAPLRRFVLPGGCPLACRLHLARTVCRRAERRCVSLAASEKVSPLLIRYLNRLSDLLFVMARRANVIASVPDVEWVSTSR